MSARQVLSREKSVENKDINWQEITNKQIYNIISENMHGGTFPYQYQNTLVYDQCIKNIFNKNSNSQKSKGLSSG